MSELPCALAEAGEGLDDTVLVWWEALSADNQAEHAILCDLRQDDFFGPEADAPRVRGGRFIPHDDAWGFAEWGPEWFDHLLAHPEVVQAMVPRTFHICTLHPAARAALAAGHIPTDFTCPFASAECPMRRLLAASPGHSVRLAGAVGPNGMKRVVALPVLSADHL